MAGSKKKAPAKKGEVSRTPRLPWSRLIPTFLLIAACVGIPWGIISAQRSLRAAVASHEPLSLVMPPLPEWIAERGSPEPLAREILKSRPTARQLSDRLLESPWVRSASVRQSGTKLLVSLKYRKPTLSIEWGDGRYCFTDESGIVLEVATLTALGGSSCLTIKGLEPTGLPTVGQPLQDDRVASIGMWAQHLQALREPLGLESVEVSSKSNRRFPSVTLFTRAGGRILWGPLGKNDENKRAILVERARKSATVPPGEVWDIEGLTSGLTRSRNWTDSPTPRS